MTLIFKAAVASATALMLAGPAIAHHSPAMYDRSKSVTAQVTVKAMTWVNPHANIQVVTDAKPGEASRTLTVEMSSPGVLTRAGWTKRTFTPGERIELTYAPLRSGGPAGLFVNAKNAEGKVFTWNFRPGEQPNLE